MKSDKRGIFFSIDALIALSVILIGTLIIYPTLISPAQESFIQGDLIEVLSKLEVGEINNSYVQDLISQGILTDLNKTVLEQIGELYITNESLSRSMTSAILADINSTENFGIWIGDELIASSNSSSIGDAMNIRTDRQVISGLRVGESITAFSARAFLSESLQNKYFYFGGYVGEGNLSARIQYAGDIKFASLEAVASEDFEVYINGNYSGNFSKSPSMFVPSTYVLPEEDFFAGENIVEIQGENLTIQGGFIKLRYLRRLNTNLTNRRYFPGIEGIVNLYDGLEFPKNISAMEVNLHVNTTLQLFLMIGNVTVYNNTPNGEEIILINDSTLSSLLDYDDLLGKTVPMRIGIENFSNNYSEQATNISGDFFARLYEDSYIEINTTVEDLPFGLITTTEELFDNSTQGTFNLPPNSQFLEGRVVSYSGPRWTDEIKINSNFIYDSSDYNLDYSLLGDPYSVNIPKNHIQENNVIDLSTGSPLGLSTEGSSSNKIIYTILQTNVSAYSSLSSVAEGCIWNLEFESGNQISVNVPLSYAGTETCFYITSGQNISNGNDAMQIAVLRLLELLDFNTNGKLDVEFTSQDLKVTPSALVGIPYDWSTEIQVRTWI